MKLLDIILTESRLARVAEPEIEQIFSEYPRLDVNQFYEIYGNHFEDRYDDEDFDDQTYDADVNYAWYWYEHHRWPPMDWSPFETIN